MQISVVVLMCQTLGTISQPVCHEEVAARIEAPTDQCDVSQAALAQWKGASIYRNDSWWIKRIMCRPADYVVKDSI